MTAKLFDLTDYRKRKPEGRRSKNENVVDSHEIGDLCQQRRLKAARKHGESLKGRNFPADFGVGYDEPVPDAQMEDHLMRSIFGDDYDEE